MLLIFEINTRFELVLGILCKSIDLKNRFYPLNKGKANVVSNHFSYTLNPQGI